MTQELFIPGPLPGLNELLEDHDARWVSRRGKRSSAYRKTKKEWHGVIGALAVAARLRRVDHPVVLSFSWRERNRRRDIDNVAAGGCKLIADALVRVGVLPNDGWKWIRGLRHEFEVDKLRPGVLVRLEEIE